jgi:hypothetical protein
MSGWPLMSVQIPYMNDGEAFTVFLSGQYAQWFNTFETPDVTRTENGGVDATDYLHAQPVSVPPFPGCRHGVVDPLLASDTFVPRCRQKALKSVDNPLLKADLKAVRSGKVMSTLQFLIFKGVYYAAFISRDLDAISVVKVSRSNFEEMCYLKSNVRLVSR